MPKRGKQGDKKREEIVRIKSKEVVSESEIGKTRKEGRKEERGKRQKDDK